MSKKRRGLSPEEAALWGRVADTARPLKPARKKPAPKLALPAVVPSPARPAFELPTFRIGETAAAPARRHVIQPGISEHLGAQPVRMDKKAFARMTRGKSKPEAKLDLHGMTLAEAHPALIRFVLRARGAGLRLILVVTGKGRDTDSPGPIPAPRGILRHQVPLWLAQPPLGGTVLQITEAHQRHGGTGAYYVYLRRSPGAATAPQSP
jgi:DNA-nicking Smr family endonuclease